MTNEPTPAEQRDYPPLPEPAYFAGPRPYVLAEHAYVADQMHAYYDRGRADGVRYAELECKHMGCADCGTGVYAGAASPTAQAAPPRWLSDQVGGDFDDMTSGQGYRKGWNDCRDTMIATQAAPAAGAGPTMDDAVAAADGTLHGAIDYWQKRALSAEEKLLWVLEDAAMVCDRREARANREDVRATCRLCAKDIRALKAAPTAAPQSPAEAPDNASFWPVDGNASRKQLIAQIGQMNFRLVALRQENSGLLRRVRGQVEALQNHQKAQPAQAQEMASLTLDSSDAVLQGIKQLASEVADRTPDSIRRSVIRLANRATALQHPAPQQAVPTSEQAGVPDSNGDATSREQYRRMFHAACSDLGAINEALGLDPDDGGAEPILAAIEILKSNAPASGGAAPVAEGDALPDEDVRELAAIGRAVNRAAIELPPGARIQIELERDAGTVYWMDDAKGAWRHIEGSGELFSVQINAAIDAARAQAKNGGANG